MFPYCIRICNCFHSQAKGSGHLLISRMLSRNRTLDFELSYFGTGLSKQVNLTACVPRKMKDDLQILADRNGMKLSKYVRTVVIRQLTGYLYSDETGALETAPFGDEEASVVD